MKKERKKKWYLKAEKTVLHALFQETKKDVPLQVHNSSNPKMKKGLKEGVKHCLFGSLSIEAAVSLTLFLFFTVFLTVPMELLNTQRQVQMVLESEARKMTQQAWLFFREEETEESSGEILFAQGAAALLLERKIRDAVGEGRLTQLDCSATEISADGEWIDLRASYKAGLPFSVFRPAGISMSSRSRRRSWVGREGGRKFGEMEENGQQRMVYVGRDSVRYHSSPECHYLSNHLIPVTLEQVGRKRNESGEAYRPCSVCGGASEPGDIVYLFSNGECYHRRRDCSSLSSYIRQVPLSEVEYLGACSYCGGMK